MIDWSHHCSLARFHSSQISTWPTQESVVNTETSRSIGWQHNPMLSHPCRCKTTSPPTTWRSMHCCCWRWQTEIGSCTITNRLRLWLSNYHWAEASQQGVWIVCFVWTFTKVNDILTNAIDAAFPHVFWCTRTSKFSAIQTAAGSF